MTSTQSNQELVRWIRFVNMGLIALAIILVAVPAIMTWWISRQLPVVSTVSIDNVQMLTPPELCPGDLVSYSYSFHAKGTGVLVRDRVLWRDTPPPKTMVFSASRRFIIADPIDQELTESWKLPRAYVNPETDSQEPLPPGNYRILFAISSPSRSSVIDIDSLAFVIPPDC